MPSLLLFLAPFFVPVLIGCAKRLSATRPVDTEAPSENTAAASGDREPAILVVYRRTGGIVGTDDRVVVWSDGFAQVAGRVFGAGSGKVPDEQVTRLRKLLRGWEGLPSPETTHAPDAFVVEVVHADKAVIADDASPRVPDQFRQVREALEAIAREVLTR